MTSQHRYGASEHSTSVETVRKRRGRNEREERMRERARGKEEETKKIKSQ